MNEIIHVSIRFPPHLHWLAAKTLQETQSLALILVRKKPKNYLKLSKASHREQLQILRGKQVTLMWWWCCHFIHLWKTENSVVFSTISSNSAPVNNYRYYSSFRFTFTRALIWSLGNCGKRFHFLIPLHVGCNRTSAWQLFLSLPFLEERRHFTWTNEWAEPVLIRASKGCLK